jgi:hypothetical protein
LNKKYWHILWWFGIYFGQLVYSMPIWLHNYFLVYFVPRFGKLFQYKSGSPA